MVKLPQKVCTIHIYAWAGFLGSSGGDLVHTPLKMIENGEHIVDYSHNVTIRKKIETSKSTDAPSLETPLSDDY